MKNKVIAFILLLVGFILGFNAQEQWEKGQRLFQMAKRQQEEANEHIPGSINGWRIVNKKQTAQTDDPMNGWRLIETPKVQAKGQAYDPMNGWRVVNGDKTEVPQESLKEPLGKEGHYGLFSKRYIGRKEKDLIDIWGVPNDTYLLGDVKYLVYENSTFYNREKGLAIKLWWRVTFTIENGVVVDWRCDGNKCSNVIK